MSKLETELTVETLNDIQAQWMALDSTDPQPVKSRVFRAMEQMPRQHLSLSRDGTLANVFDAGLPFFSAGRPLAEARRWCELRGIQTRFAWQCDKWVELAAEPVRILNGFAVDAGCQW